MRTQLVRMAVLEIYEQVRREGARADQALQRVLRREKQLRSVERRAVSDAVYGLLRLQGRVDHLLQRALGTRKLALEKLEGVTEANIKLVMSPPWTPDRMTDEARDQLGIF